MYVDYVLRLCPYKYGADMYYSLCLFDFMNCSSLWDPRVDELNVIVQMGSTYLLWGKCHTAGCINKIS